MINTLDLETSRVDEPKKKQESLFPQLSLCINRPLLESNSFILIRQLGEKAKQRVLFIRGSAVSLILQPELLLKTCQLLFKNSVKIYLCSSAYEDILHDPNSDVIQIQKQLKRLDQDCIIKSCEVAGLGTWIECTQLGPTLDFSALSHLPSFVAITSHPATNEFIDQIDLALAAAAFDLEPVLLLLNNDVAFLDRQLYPTQAKKLDSAEVYGIKKCLSGDAAHSFLQTHLNQFSLVIPHFELPFYEISTHPKLNPLTLSSDDIQLHASSFFLVV